MDDNGRVSAPGYRAILVVSLGVVALFVWHLKLRYLFVFDSVNFALALDRFNVGLHQPQPPGDPGFVLLAKLLHRVLSDPTDVFFLLGLIAAGLASWLVTRLGVALGNGKAGVAAAVLLLFHTATTSSIVISPVRNFLAVSSALIAWLAWLTWSRSQSGMWFIASATALGLCSSFRPELAVTLLPVILVPAFSRRVPWWTYVIAAALLTGGIFLWVVPTARPVGGLLAYVQVLKVYFAQQAQVTEASNASFGVPPWLFMLWRAIVWTCSGVVTWIWILPFVWRSQTWVRDRKLMAFLVTWALPSFLLSCFLHIQHAGHALATIVPLCIAGGFVLSAIRPSFLFVLALGVCAYLNLYTFKHPMQADDEASTAHLRALNQYWSPPVEELIGLRGYQHLFVATDSSGLSWRTLHYYLPNTPLLLFERDVPGTATFFPVGGGLVRLEKIATIPSCGKIAWLVKDAEKVPAQTQDSADSDWKGSFYMTNGRPDVKLTVNGLQIQSDDRLCSK